MGSRDEAAADQEAGAIIVLPEGESSFGLVIDRDTGLIHSHDGSLEIDQRTGETRSRRRIDENRPRPDDEDKDHDGYDDRTGNVTVRTDRDDDLGHWEYFSVPQKSQGQILKDAITRIKDRFKSNRACRELFDNIDPETYLDNNVFIGTQSVLGEVFAREAAFATPITIGTQRYSGGVIVMNQNGYFFSGQITGQSTNIMNVLTPVIRERNGLQILNFDELQEQILLHELMHLNDAAGKYNDRGTGNAPLNNLIGTTCYRL